MKVSQQSFSDQKIETAQMILSLQDPTRLARVRKALEENEPTPQAILDAIARGIAEADAGLGTPIEEFLEEMKTW